MSSVEVKVFCPLGAKCEEAKDGAIHRCAWYTYVKGFDSNIGETIDKWSCALEHFPRLLIENSNMQRQTGNAICDFRNKMVEANQTTQKVLLTAMQQNGSELPFIAPPSGE